MTTQYEDTYNEYIKSPGDWVSIQIVDTIALKKMMLDYLLSREDKEIERSTVRMTDISSNLLRIVDYETKMNSKTKTLSALLFLGTTAFMDKVDANLWDEFEHSAAQHDMDNIIRGTFVLTDGDRYLTHINRGNSLLAVKSICQDVLSTIFKVPNSCTYPTNYYKDEYVNHIFDIFRVRFGMAQHEIVDIVMMFALYNSDIILKMPETHAKFIDDMIKYIPDMFNKSLTLYLSSSR